MKDWKGENIMRDILFRGKRVENDDWVYGDLIHEPWGDCIQVMEKDNINTFKRTKYSVHNKTVGQYTGLKDENGVKIFEGDILSRDNIRGHVSYSDELCRFVFRWKSYDKYRPDFFKECALADFAGIHLVKVIGNIHDNPELLKEGGEG